MEEDQSAPTAMRDAAAEASARNTAAAVRKRKQIATQRATNQTAAKAEAARLKQEAQAAAKVVKAEAKVEAKVAKQEEKCIAAEKRKTQPAGSTNKGAPPKVRPNMNETPVSIPKWTRSLPLRSEEAEEIEYPKTAKARARSNTKDPTLAPQAVAIRTNSRGRSRTPVRDVVKPLAPLPPPRRLLRRRRRSRSPGHNRPQCL